MPSPPTMHFASCCRLALAAGLALTGSAIAAAPGVLDIASGEPAAALVYWTAPAAASPLPAPKAGRPHTGPMWASRFVEGSGTERHALRGYSAVRIPAGTWRISMMCSARNRQGVTELSFEFEPGRSYLLQCGGSARRIDQPTATDVTPTP